MWKNRVAWSIILLAALGLYLFENNAGTRVLLLALLAAPLCSALCLYLPRRAVAAALSLPETPRRGEDAEGVLTLENAAALPLSVRAELRIGNLLTGETTCLPFSGTLRGKAARAFAFSLRAGHCGVLELTVERAALADPLGLFSRRLPAFARRRALVPPELSPVGVSLAETADALYDSQTYSAQKPGYDPSESFRIREYVPGDPIRQIHWKLSEKTDRLLARDFGLPVAERMLLLLDAAAPAAPEALDEMLDLLFSLSAALLRADGPHTVGWRNGPAGTYEDKEIHTEDDLIELQTLMLSAPPGGAVDGFLQSHVQCAYAHVAVVASAPVPDAELLCQGNRVTVLLPAGADAGDELSSGVGTLFYTPRAPGEMQFEI